MEVAGETALQIVTPEGTRLIMAPLDTLPEAMKMQVDLEWDDGHVLPPKVYPDVAFLFQRLNEVTVAAVEAGGGEVVLDIGCGRAIDAIEVARKGGKCLGLEPSKRMIEQGRKCIAASGAEVSLVQGIGEHLPFKTGSLDRVVCKGSLDHFPDPAKALEEMARVLKPGGRAIIAIANFECLGFRLGRALLALQRLLRRGKTGEGNIWQIPPDHTYKFDHASLRHLVKPYLKVEGCTGVSLLFGLPHWSSLLARLPSGVSRAILVALDGLACRLAPLSDGIVLTCSPRANPDAGGKLIA